VTRTRIKICGITRPEDALAAARAGADAIGLVFYKPAPRCVSLETARQILGVLPPFVTPVGLFVDAAVGEILQTTGELGLRQVQLHGQESPDVVMALGGRAVIKAVRVTREGLAEELSRWRGVAALRGLVLETGGTQAAGGTGVENDWELIRQMQSERAFEGLPPIIAAGGLRPETVGHVIRTLRPWAVDVSSGVERVRGEKSQELIERFVREVAAAE
jgi:phosphoribosylanthranilate isomerase